MYSQFYGISFMHPYKQSGRWQDVFGTLIWMHIYNLIIVSSTCFEHPSVHPQEDLYSQFYGISFMHPNKQSGRWQDVFGTLIWMHERNTIKLHVQVFLRMNTWMFETCRRHYN